MDSPDRMIPYYYILGTLIALRSAGIDRNLLIEMNDSGFTFDEIADYVDQTNQLTNLNQARCISV